MFKIIEWTKSRLDQIYIRLGRSSQYAEGLLICCYSDGSQQCEAWWPAPPYNMGTSTVRHAFIKRI